MELLMEFLMELVPDALTEFFSEKCFGMIKAHVENRFLQKVLYALAVLILATVGVAIAFSIVCVIAVLFE